MPFLSMVTKAFLLAIKLAAFANRLSLEAQTLKSPKHDFGSPVSNTISPSQKHLQKLFAHSERGCVWFALSCLVDSATPRVL